MRFGLVVEPPVGSDATGALDLVQEATAAQAAGFDLVWLADCDGFSPSVAASALAACTSSLHVGVQLDVGSHPVYLAEEAAVADLCLGGRLVVCLAGSDEDLLAETTDVVLDALAARPFRHDGARWRIPANLPANVVNRAGQVRVTPASAQLEMPVWLAGGAAQPVAADRCLTFVGDSGDSTASMTAAWTQAETRWGPATRRLRRVAVRAVVPTRDGSVDRDAVVAELRADQRSWGMDVALIRLPAKAPTDARVRAVDELAHWVLPRVQLDRYPDGLEQYWTQRREAVR